MTKTNIKQVIDTLKLTPKEKMTPEMETQLKLYTYLFHKIESTNDQNEKIDYILIFYDLYNRINKKGE